MEAQSVLRSSETLATLTSSYEVPAPKHPVPLPSRTDTRLGSSSMSGELQSGSETTLSPFAGGTQQDQAQLAPSSSGVYKRALCKKLALLKECELTIVDGVERLRFGTANGNDVLRATVRLHDPEMWRQVALSGSVGVAESYMQGQWSVDDMVALVRIFVRNRNILDAMETGTARFGQWVMRMWHQRRRNTKSGSQRNIAAHYDLSNALFKTFLDPTMMYSCALYAHPEETLEVAAVRKLDRICLKLELKPSDHLVEIGTGWGGFAIHAARNYGCRVTTTTMSQEQFDYALARVQEAGLSSQITVLKNDYRELTGQYDKLVSIEMIEAIGHQYLDVYFATCGRLLKDEGLALIQAITIEDSRYSQALKDVDFIKRHIFPGSFIPSISAMLGASAKSSDLKLVNLEDIGPSYAHTLKAWRERFMGALEQVRLLGFDETFIRMWHYYLAYCEGGFIERSIGNVHLLLAKPRNLRTQFLPDLGNSV